MMKHKDVFHSGNVGFFEEALVLLVKGIVDFTISLYFKKRLQFVFSSTTIVNHRSFNYHFSKSNPPFLPAMVLWHFKKRMWFLCNVDTNDDVLIKKPGLTICGKGPFYGLRLFPNVKKLLGEIVSKQTHKIGKCVFRISRWVLFPSLINLFSEKALCFVKLYCFKTDDFHKYLTIFDIS